MVLPPRVLDTGAGTGHFAKAIKEMWARDVYATELTRNYITEPGIIVEEVHLDCDPLPYPDNFSDYVTFIETIEHLEAV
ncbi:MAG TPA: class I SAM-dependent methyltransferase [Candidatus Scalindua sp.]|nr:class I SAM-dependent methyltransferase [Candidatus Scalindua sp.]